MNLRCLAVMEDSRLTAMLTLVVLAITVLFSNSLIMLLTFIPIIKILVRWLLFLLHRRPRWSLTMTMTARSASLSSVINEALWFGPTKEHTLISSNQVRAYGVQLWDNPCDPNHGLFIHNTTIYHIVPLYMDGIVAFVETHAPTDEEILRLPHVHMTSDAPWHPNNASYCLQMTEEGHVKVQRNGSFAETTKEATESSSLFPSVANPGIFGSLDPDLWQSPDLSVVHNQRFDSRFPYSDVSTSDLTFTNISCVYSSSFADEATSIFPRKQGLAMLLRNGGFSVKA